MGQFETAASTAKKFSTRTARNSAALLGLLLALCGCRHRQKVADQPAPPPLNSHRSQRHETGRQTQDRDEASVAPPASLDLNAEEADAPRGFFDDTRGRPVFTETGLASWYGPNYQHHAAADGSVYQQDQMTAAERTLPLGSTVRVTNLETGQQVLVRITDRGPFSPGRVLDLSLGAAKAVGVYRAGVARVKVEAFAHATADPAGKWCVQTGAFQSKDHALDLKNALLRRYRGARVMEFEGPTGYWVRIDPLEHGKKQAAEIADWIGKPDSAALPYLVRLD